MRWAGKLTPARRVPGYTETAGSHIRRVAYTSAPQLRGRRIAYSRAPRRHTRRVAHARKRARRCRRKTGTTGLRIRRVVHAGKRARRCRRRTGTTGLRIRRVAHFRTLRRVRRVARARPDVERGSPGGLHPFPAMARTRSGRSRSFAFGLEGRGGKRLARHGSFRSVPDGSLGVRVGIGAVARRKRAAKHQYREIPHLTLPGSPPARSASLDGRKVDGCVAHVGRRVDEHRGDHEHRSKHHQHEARKCGLDSQLPQ